MKRADARRVGDEVLARPAAKKLPFAFVLDELDALSPRTNPMFGCTAVYVGDKIVLILRARGGRDDDGVWVATTAAHHASLRLELPSLRSIMVFGPGESGWQVIPAESDTFESEVLRVCAMVRAGDPRVGKVPKKKKRV